MIILQRPPNTTQTKAIWGWGGEEERTILSLNNRRNSTVKESKAIMTLFICFSLLRKKAKSIIQ
jgi:hypothetical protein